MDEKIINKVAQSGIITIELENYLPKGEWAAIDLKDYLYEGLILKEKDYREKLASTNWEDYKDKHVAVSFTADAIIPLWAFMLITTHLQPVAASVHAGTIAQAKEKLLVRTIQDVINPDDYTDARVVIKGCGDESVPEAAYLEITRILQPVVKSLMYGEPCSTVPIYKKKKA